MNIIDIILCLILLAAMLNGFHNGILLSILSLVRFVISVPLALFVSDKYSETVYNDHVRQVVLDSVNDGIAKSPDMTSYIDSITKSVSFLPKSVLHKMDMAALGDMSAEKASVYITDKIAAPIVMTLTQIVLFLIVIIAFLIVFGIMIAIISGIRKKSNSLIKKTGSFLGGIFGILRGMLSVVLLCGIAYYAIDFIGTQDSQFMKYLSESVIIEFINQYNPLVSIF